MTLLEQRAKTHGDFIINCQISQDLKSVMRDSPNWNGLTVSQAEALDMIAHKIGRILAGDSQFQDHWDDLAGYAHLAAERTSCQSSSAKPVA